FTDIWVRITDDQDRLMFAGGLSKADFGLTGLTFLFPRPGSYNVFTRFSNGSVTVVEATAPLTIENPKRSGWPIGMSEMLAFLIGAALAAGVAFMLFKLSGRVPQGISQKMSDPAPDQERQFSCKNLIITVMIGLVCSALAFYATMYMLDRGQAKTLSRQSAAPLQQPVLDGEVPIVLTNNGFVPSEVAIKKGTTVTFSTDPGRPFSPASNLHPNHEEYPAFDPKEPIPPGETWSFT